MPDAADGFAVTCQFVVLRCTGRAASRGVWSAASARNACALSCAFGVMVSFGVAEGVGLFGVTFGVGFGVFSLPPCVECGAQLKFVFGVVCG